MILRAPPDAEELLCPWSPFLRLRIADKFRKVQPFPRVVNERFKHLENRPPTGYKWEGPKWAF